MGDPGRVRSFVLPNLWVDQSNWIVNTWMANIKERYALLFKSARRKRISRGQPPTSAPVCTSLYLDDRKTGSNCCYQAVTLKTPGQGSVSVMGILQQLRAS